MKTVAALALVFLLFAVPSFASETHSDSVKVLSTKRYLFYFKADKRLIGGTVEVFDANQHMVATEKITQAKTIVDFFNLRAGHYTIRIKQGEEEFVYPYDNAN